MPTAWPDAEIIEWASVHLGRLWVWLHTSGPAEWALVVVGILGIDAALRTLRAVEGQATAASDAAAAAMEANAITREALLADQRPWVSLEVEIAGPLIYTSDGWDAGVRWHVPLKCRLQHLGKTPAIKVALFGSIRPSTLAHWTKSSIKDGRPEGEPVPGTDVPKELESICAFNEGFSSLQMGFGEVLFPNEGKDRLFGMNGNPQFFEDAKNSEGYGGQFLVCMCVTYESTLGSSKYRTAQAFLLYKRAGTQKIDLAGETLAPEEIVLARYPLASGSCIQ